METDLSIDFLLLVLALLLHHEDRMIEEEHLKFCAFALRSSSFHQRTLVDQLSLLVSQPQILAFSISASTRSQRE